MSSEGPDRLDQIFTIGEDVRRAVMQDITREEFEVGMRAPGRMLDRLSEEADVADEVSDAA